MPAPSFVKASGRGTLVEATPDVASLVVKSTLTSEPFQPLAFAAGVAGPNSSPGGDASRAIVTLPVEAPPVEVAEHVIVMPVVSWVRVVEPQPGCDVIADSGSLTENETVTSPTYQPLAPTGPLALGVITGGVESGVVFGRPEIRNTRMLYLSLTYSR